MSSRGKTLLKYKIYEEKQEEISDEIKCQIDKLK